jgi:hypothetical protein
MSHLIRATVTLAAFVMTSCATAPPSTTAPRPATAPQAVTLDVRERADAFAKAYHARLCEDPGACRVTITVNDNCDILPPDPYVLGLIGNSPMFRNVTIQWRIDNQSKEEVEFLQPGGITPKDPVAWNKEFDQENPGAKIYTWRDKNPTAMPPRRAFGYIVKVKQGGRDCTPLDPTVVNDY